MRHAKQLIYGVMYLIFWIGVGSAVYFHYIKPAPSCFDNLQNQGEEGIDCGVVCSRECIPALQPLKANSVWALPIVLAPMQTANSPAFIATSTADISRMTLLAQLRNPNPDYGAASFNYTFTLYDANGKEIASFPGSSYIYGSEVKYIALPNQQLPPGNSRVQSATLAITQPAWKKTILFARPTVTASILRVDVNGTLAVQGTVHNAEAVPLHVDLTSVFYDASGNPKGASVTALERLAAGETRQFAIFHPLMDGIASDRTQVFASSYTTH